MKPSQSPAVVMIVDDQSDNVTLVGQLLEVSGYQVIPALSGEQALRRAQERRPDLVLLDMLMPKMSGSEVCKRLRELPGLAEVPVIFLTAVSEREFLSQAFAAGAVDYVVKPFVNEELLARVRTHVELKRARDRMAAMLREREDVTNIVAHDLKNPLSNILFAAQLLERGSNDAVKGPELIRDIHACAEEALQFIQRFLSRRAEGQHLRQFSAEQVDLAKLAAETIQLQNASAVARGVELQLEGGDAPVNADPLATRNVLQNLISNAIRYSPQGQRVQVEVGPSRPGYTKCLVMDNGPGITEEDQQKLFKRFVRLATAKDAGGYSSGLGLAIAKHDVVQMGGHLWYEARPGGGSVFAFELPKQRVVEEG
jgi:two-component system, sensor histidine kinase and response regulator